MMVKLIVVKKIAGSIMVALWKRNFMTEKKKLAI